MQPPGNITSISTLIILGSGMSGCFSPDEIELVDGSHSSSVDGHPGRLALLKRDRSVMLALGRRHLYEGWSLEEVQQTVRHAAGLGARNLLVTNAAGGLNPIFMIGDIMLIMGSLPLMLGSTLVRKGKEDGRRGIPGFSIELYPEIIRQGMERGLALRSGVYAGVTGPSYETRAEIRMLRRVGADAVGMSTLPEVAAARERGMLVVGLSLITNRLSDSVRLPLDHLDVVEQGRLAHERVRGAIEGALEVLQQ